MWQYHFVMVQLVVGIGKDSLGAEVQQLVYGALMAAQLGGAQHMDTEAGTVLVRQPLQEWEYEGDVQRRTTEQRLRETVSRERVSWKQYHVCTKSAQQSIMGKNRQKQKRHYPKIKSLFLIGAPCGNKQMCAYMLLFYVLIY